MLSEFSRIGPPRRLFLAVVALATLPPLAAAQTRTETQTLTNDAVVQLIRWKMTDAEIVAVIERNDTQFDLTPSTVALLKGSGVDDTVLEAMWKATLRSSRTAQPAPAPAAATPAPASSSPVTSSQTMSQIPPHTPERLAAAKAVKAETETVSPPACLKKARRHIQADWESGSISPSRVNFSGPACFEVHNFNDVLYVAAFSLTEIPPQGSDIDLLKGAMGALTGLFTGRADNTKPAVKAEQEQKLREKAIPPPSCPAGLHDHLEAAQAKASALRNALAGLDPGKDSNGKINYVPLATTLAIWQAQAIPEKYDAFETAVGKVIADLNSSGADNCTEDILRSAEGVVLESYVPARTQYISASRAASEHIVRYTEDLEATSAYDFVVKPTYGGAETNAGSKTFHLSAGRKILTASAGFLITELSARSYSSRTVPTGMNNSATQNVLGVDFGNGPRPALTALLNYHLFFADWHRFGFALSAGPVFDISSGKADTSRLGFFGGASLHLWNRLYVTPGVHVGEFADFPQGFTAGSIIPLNTGTPQPSKRWTARFAVGITFKVKDLGETATKSSSETATSASSAGAGGSASAGPSGQSGKQKPKQ